MRLAAIVKVRILSNAGPSLAHIAAGPKIDLPMVDLARDASTKTLSHQTSCSSMVRTGKISRHH